MEIQSSVYHENIIKFYDIIEEKEALYFLMEYAENGCLLFYIHSSEGLPQNLAFRFFYQTCLAIEYLHSHDIIHRDIKPENILLDSQFKIKLCDFGASCIMKENEFRQGLCGTYEYMSPEVVLNLRYSKKVDIWCLGILLYELLHGMPPFSAESLEDIKYQLLNNQIKIKNHIDVDIKDLLVNLLKFDENERFDIQGVLQHPAVVDRLFLIRKPLDRRDFYVLEKNFILNFDLESENRFLPEILEKDQKLNGYLVKSPNNNFFNPKKIENSKADVLIKNNFNDIKKDANLYDVKKNDFSNSNFFQTKSDEYNYKELKKDTYLGKIEKEINVNNFNRSFDTGEKNEFNKNRTNNKIAPIKFKIKLCDISPTKTKRILPTIEINPFNKNDENHQKLKDNNFFSNVEKKLFDEKIEKEGIKIFRKFDEFGLHQKNYLNSEKVDDNKNSKIIRITTLTNPKRKISENYSENINLERNQFFQEKKPKKYENELPKNYFNKNIIEEDKKIFCTSSKITKFSNDKMLKKINYYVPDENLKKDLNKFYSDDKFELKSNFPESKKISINRKNDFDILSNENNRHKINLRKNEIFTNSPNKPKIEKKVKFNETSILKNKKSTSRKKEKNLNKNRFNKKLEISNKNPFLNNDLEKRNKVEFSNNSENYYLNNKLTKNHSSVNLFNNRLFEEENKKNYNNNFDLRRISINYIKKFEI